MLFLVATNWIRVVLPIAACLSEPLSAFAEPLEDFISLTGSPIALFGGRAWECLRCQLNHAQVFALEILASCSFHLLCQKFWVWLPHGEVRFLQ